VPEGPICAIGGVGSGWSLYIKDEHFVYCYNNNGKRYYVRSTKRIPARGGQIKLRFEFEKTGKEKFGASGIGRLYINNEKAGEAEIPHTVRFVYAIDESFDIGHDTGSPVTDEYKAGAVFTGVIKKVVIGLAGERQIDPETEARVVMKRQ
jgi:arylsulfatase